MSKTYLSTLTGFCQPQPTRTMTNPQEPTPTSPGASEQEPPFFQWDYWEMEALEDGMEKSLAALGRAVMREACQHNWSPRVAALCSDYMLDRLLVQAPKRARRLYEVLLETDGLRYILTEKQDSLETIELGGLGF